MEAIVELMDANQAPISAKGDRLRSAGQRGLCSPHPSTGLDQGDRPGNLVGNRQAPPDAFDGKFLAAQVIGVIVPENYVASCVACHVEPRDIAGYPREAVRLDQPGLAISITLVR